MNKDTVLRKIDRVNEIVGTYGNTGVGPDQLERFDLARLQVEHCKTELVNFILQCYKKLPDGYWANIHSDGQIPKGVIVPWSSRGKYSSLTKTQRAILRQWIMDHRIDQPYSLFKYDRELTRWYIRINRFPTIKAALDWLDNCGLTAEVWLQYAERIRNRK